MKIVTPSHLAAVGEAVSRRPAPSSAPNATAPNAAHARRYPARNRLIRRARRELAVPPAISRVHSTATGATDGSIIAAIMTTHSPRNGSNPRPIVPGPLPMLWASPSVTAHAIAARTATAIHGGAVCRLGRVRASGGTAAGTHPAGATPSPAWPSDRKTRTECYLRRHAADGQSTSSRRVQRAVRLLEGDRGWLDARDLADQRPKAGQVAASAAGEDSTQGLRLLGRSPIVQVKCHLPAAVRHPFRRVHGHHGVETGQVNPVLVAFRDMPCEEHIAVLLSGGPQPHAVAADV